ncbi:4-(cytidine 5'-diphospho)-2-C-methyl-D-erythritol kinase [Novosphingobium sp.]|uniref:4-(cytidine 5'-diphospho)-2-C-methyl-D-erythritol kinase n=1 Tax=Novosphingobium sp. TaxID=1874826 RepID=UPI00333EDA1A
MPADPTSETAYAKINLALHVRGRRTDGYHDLETLFAFVDAGDTLTAVEAEHFSLTVTGPFAAALAGETDNLVLRAARLMAKYNGITTGLAFTLDKHLPIASGIGGGSADAAAALRLATRIWGPHRVTWRASDFDAELGADVPACGLSRTCFGSGVGDRVVDFAIDGLAGAPVLLVNPQVACPTGPVFRRWDGIDQGPLDPVHWLDARNDLEAPAIALVPVIGDVLNALRQTGARVTRMSGSGATCFALFDYAVGRDRAARQIMADHPEWWTLCGNLR